MRAHTIHACVRGLKHLALFAVMAHPAVPRAQVPRVTSARLTFHVTSHGVGVDTGYTLLIIRIGGLPGQQLRALKRADVVISDSENRRYTPEAYAIRGGDALDGDENVDRQWLFRVPPAHTAFKLRLATFAPVPFTATYSMSPWPVRRP
jgi:hypothetical protein